jgi:hypothetical protein
MTLHYRGSLSCHAEDGLARSEKADVVDSSWERIHLLMTDCLCPDPDDSHRDVGIADFQKDLFCHCSVWISSTCPVQAQLRAPSIIFMDELDGLVPARSGRSGGADQIYASVVSTLLALMDGVTDRGAVVVLAATNRCHHSAFWMMI